MSRAIFITGTDTGVGKTHVSLALVAALQQKSLRVAAYKPIETGALGDDSDAIALLCDTVVPWPADHIRVVRLLAAISVHAR